ncbi:TPA: hypothetical protein N0F65_004233 [Lagenidium giganteum]|uniref:Uncharacterized protein n=1 Tax=Lagenidium giganteum TaxID=4803 RepID=A0AAV2ZDT0_9STRA|nr:TPA: hypothetical protein N0F65_004233 [Lagenidium giganteum]
MVYTYDCQDMNDTTARKGQLDFLDERALLTLNFAHCSELVVPSDIQHFPNLLGMNLKHLTLADWPMDAAVTADYFPNMLFLVFSHVNWSCLPDGILGPLPNGLQDIELTHTNLSVIPDGLDQHWPGVATLYIG